MVNDKRAATLVSRSADTELLELTRSDYFRVRAAPPRPPPGASRVQNSMRPPVSRMTQRSASQLPPCAPHRRLRGTAMRLLETTRGLSLSITGPLPGRFRASLHTQRLIQSAPPEARRRRLEPCGAPVWRAWSAARAPRPRSAGRPRSSSSSPSSPRTCSPTCRPRCAASRTTSRRARPQTPRRGTAPSPWPRQTGGRVCASEIAPGAAERPQSTGRLLLLTALRPGPSRRQTEGSDSVAGEEQDPAAGYLDGDSDSYGDRPFRPGKARRRPESGPRSQRRTRGWG